MREGVIDFDPADFDYRLFVHFLFIVSPSSRPIRLTSLAITSLKQHD